MERSVKEATCCLGGASYFDIPEMGQDQTEALSLLSGFAPDDSTSPSVAYLYVHICAHACVSM